MNADVKVPRWGRLPEVAGVLYDDKRRRILREAGAVFGEVGFHNATMEVIAARLGLTKAALYYYFPDKGELLLRCFDLGFEVAEAALADALAAEAPGIERVTLFAQRYVEGMTADLGACGAALDLRSAPPEAMPSLRKKMRVFDRRLRALIETGISDRSIAPIDSTLAVNWIMGAMTMLPRWYRQTARLSASEVGQTFAEFTRRMLSTTGAIGMNQASESDSTTPMETP